MNRPLYAREPKVWTPHQYQASSIQFLHERTIFNPEGKGGGGLFLDPGMGKTSIILEWFLQMKTLGVANRFLIVAPLRVCYNVWPEEVLSWKNFRTMSYSIIHGTSITRRNRLTAPVNMHIINRDAVGWLWKQVKNKERLPWQVIVIDESTSFKNWSANRSMALRHLIKKIPYRVIMTGTPSPKNLADLYPQLWLLDEGQALGENISKFREEFCYQKGSRDENNFEVFEDRKEKIYNRIQHMCLRLDAKDHLSMPPITYSRVQVDLPPSAQRDYDAMEEEMFISLSDGSGREAVNAASKYSICRQIAAGGVYGDPTAKEKKAYEVHTAFTEAVLEIRDELQGKPVLIAYNFDHEVQRLQKAIKGLKVIRGGMNSAEVERIINGWNDGTVRDLAVHPGTMAYGINMQKGEGRDVIWFGPTDDLIMYLQLNARVYRQGVGSTVRIHQITARDTITDVIWSRLEDKFDVQSNLLEVLREYAARKRGRK